MTTDEQPPARRQRMVLYGIVGGVLVVLMALALTASSRVCTAPNAATPLTGTTNGAGGPGTRPVDSTVVHGELADIAIYCPNRRR